MQIRWNALKGVDLQIDLAPFHPNRNLDSVICKELKLSTIDPPNNRMQRTLKVIEIEDQNLCGSQSNTDCITVERNLRLVVLHQVRDQTLSGPILILGRNTFRDNIGS